MAIRRGGTDADKVYLEGERTQGLDSAFAELTKYIDLVRNLGTKEAQEIPNGVYSVKVGQESGVFVQLRMPEDVSGQVFWRFYPLSEAHPLTSPSDVVGLLECEREETRATLPGEINPFAYLGTPLRSAVSQVGAEYVAQVAALSPDKVATQLRRFLARDDLLEADAGLCAKLNGWCDQYHPIDATQRGAVSDAVRKIRLLKQDTPVEELLASLREFWAALEEAGLDRPLLRPETREPSERELELVCWELVLTKERLDVLASTTAGDSRHGRSE